MGLDDELRKAYKVKKRRQKGLHSLKKLCKTKQKSCLRNARYEKGFHSAYMLVRQHAVFF